MPHSIPQAAYPTHLLELISEVVWTATLDGQRLLYVNPAIEQVYGRPLADFCADADLWLDMVHPADRAVAEQSSRELLALGQSETTYRIVRPDGTVRWLLDRKYIVAAEAGQPQHIGGVATDITSQKQTELALQAKEERLREVLENALVASYKRYLQGDTYAYLSPVFARVTGYTPAEMMALATEKVVELIHPDDRAEIERVIARSMAGPAGTAYQVDYRFRHKDGHYRWLRDKFTVVHDEQDRPAARIGSVSDITERKQAEAALRESEEKYRAIFNNERYAIGIYDPTISQLLDVNETFVRMYGYSRAELLAGEVDLRRLTAEPEATAAMVQQASREESIFVPLRYHRKKDGSVFPVEFVIAPFSWQGRQVMFTMAHDITERKQVEADLRRSEHKFRSVIEKSPDAIVLTDHTGQIVDWNGAAVEIFGLARSQVLGRNAWDVQFEASLPAEQTPQRYELIKAGILDLLQTGQGPLANHLVEVPIRRPDGEQRVIQTLAFPVENDPGYWLGSINRDVTEPNRLEQALRESELKFRSIVENSSEAIILTDEAGRLVEWNPAAERLSGLARAEVLGRLIWDNQFRSLPRERRLPGVYEELKSLGLTYFQTGQHPWLNQMQEVEVERPDGSHRVVQTSPFSIKTERGYMLGGVVRDVTESKQAEQELRENELKFRSLVGKSADAVLLTDESGRLVEWNSAAEQLFGKARAGVLGSLVWDNLFQTLPPERQTPAHYEPFKAEWQTYFQTGRHPSLNRVVDLEIRRPDGSRRQVQSARFSVPTERGFLLGAVVRDVTEQKQAEVERERLIGELEASLAKVKQLSGLLPICANCKKIRDDQGYWQQIEIYIRDHSEAEFSHGICPECMEKLYPGYGRKKRE